MDGSDLVFLEVGTGDNSPIIELTVVIARSTQRCHGCVFQKRKKLEIGEGRQLEDAAVEECDKKKNQEDKTDEGWKKGASERMVRPQVHGCLVELGERGHSHCRLVKLHDRLTELGGRGPPHCHLAEPSGRGQLHNHLAEPGLEEW